MRILNRKILINPTIKISQTNNYLKYRRANVNLKIPLNGLELGIPLNIFQNIFTNLHYGYDITTIKSAGLQFLLGYYIYGKDRYNDAEEYINFPYETKKEDFYKLIYENKEFYSYTFNLAFSVIIIILLNENINSNIVYNIPFIPLTYINGEYKNFKQKLGVFKPLYIGCAWTISSIILPSVLYEHNYDILNSPIDYLPCILILFSSSNFADSKDIEEDRLKNINTIPVKYGKNISNIISFIGLAISSILLIENINYENRLLINSFIELQNFGIMYLIYNNTFYNDTF